jgi:prepilin-type processing-associated H-X9-DG protein
MAQKSDPGAVPVSVSYGGSCDAVDTKISSSDVGRKITSYKRPSSSFLLIEGRDLDASLPAGCFRYYRLIEYADKKKKSFQKAFMRHNGRTNVLFMDGHVERATPDQFAKQLAWQQEFYDTSPPKR